MAKFDMIIRGGIIVDGLRNPRFEGDIAIKDGRIAAIGNVEGDADSVLDARGLIVAPGFIDLHTHYDSQIYWDPWCSISSWHGVTSVAIGNCGFGFAPCKPQDRERAMLAMTRNEAVPLKTMQAGLPWDWETFPEWIESLARIPKGRRMHGRNSRPVPSTRPCDVRRADCGKRAGDRTGWVKRTIWRPEDQIQP